MANPLTRSLHDAYEMCWLLHARHMNSYRWKDMMMMKRQQNWLWPQNILIIFCRVPFVDSFLLLLLLLIALERESFLCALETKGSRHKTLWKENWDLCWDKHKSRTRRSILRRHRGSQIGTLGKIGERERMDTNILLRKKKANMIFREEELRTTFLVMMGQIWPNINLITKYFEMKTG